MKSNSSSLFQFYTVERASQSTSSLTSGYESNSLLPANLFPKVPQRLEAYKTDKFYASDYKRKDHHQTEPWYLNEKSIICSLHELTSSNWLCSDSNRAQERDKKSFMHIMDRQ